MGLYECFPRTLRTPLNTPYLSEHSKRVNRVKPFEPLGLSHKLKEIDLNALQCVERSRNRTNRNARIAQGVIRVERSEYSEWNEWIEWVELLRG